MQITNSALTPMDVASVDEKRYPPLQTLPLDCVAYTTAFLNVEEVQNFRLSRYEGSNADDQASLQGPVLTRRLVFAPDEVCMTKIMSASEYPESDGERQRLLLNWFKRELVKLPESTTDRQLMTLSQKGYLDGIQCLDLNDARALSDKVIIDLRKKHSTLQVVMPDEKGSGRLADGIEIGGNAGDDLYDIYGIYIVGMMPFFLVGIAVYSMQIFNIVSDVKGGINLQASLLERGEKATCYAALSFFMGIAMAHPVGHNIVWIVREFWEDALPIGVADWLDE